MDEQATIQEKEGKKYFLLSDKTEVLIENEVINDPAWVGIDFVPPILGLKDRQIRYKIKKLGWLKKYGSVNGKPALFLNRAQLEQYVKENPRITTASINPLPANEQGRGEGLVPEDIDNTSKGIKVLEGTEQFEAMLRTISPHIKEFVDSHKEDKVRLRELEDRKSSLEKNSVFLKTSLIWFFGVAIVSGGLWWTSHKEMINKINELSQTVSSKDQELSQTKSSLIEKDTELKTFKEVFNSQKIGTTTGEPNVNTSK